MPKYVALVLKKVLADCLNLIINLGIFKALKTFPIFAQVEAK